MKNYQHDLKNERFKAGKEAYAEYINIEVDFESKTPCFRVWDRPANEYDIWTISFDNSFKKEVADFYKGKTLSITCRIKKIESKKCDLIKVSPKKRL